MKKKVDRRISELQNNIIFLLGMDATDKLLVEGIKKIRQQLKKYRNTGKTAGEVLREIRGQDTPARVAKGEMSLIGFNEIMLELNKHKNKATIKSSVSRSLKSLSVMGLVRTKTSAGQVSIFLTKKGLDYYMKISPKIFSYIRLCEIKEDYVEENMLK